MQEVVVKALSRLFKNRIVLTWSAITLILLLIPLSIPITLMIIFFKKRVKNASQQ